MSRPSRAARDSRSTVPAGRRPSRRLRISRMADGISAAARYVEMRAEMDVTVLISNCPQLNNPCNGYNPTPVEVLVWD